MSGKFMGMTGEGWKSSVRVVVTYTLTFAYAGVAAFLIVYLMLDGDESREIALGIFSGLAAAANAIIGFWFSERSQKNRNGQ